MRTMKTSESTCAGCTVDTQTIAGELGAQAEWVFEEAPRRGFPLVVSWSGRPALSVADAAEFVADWRAYVGAHERQQRAYRVWVYEQEQRVQRERQEAADKAWFDSIAANAKLAEEHRKAAAAVAAEQAGVHHSALQKKRGVVSFETFLKETGERPAEVQS